MLTVLERPLGNMTMGLSERATTRKSSGLSTRLSSVMGNSAHCSEPRPPGDVPAGKLTDGETLVKSEPPIKGETKYGVGV